ncbi:MAG: cobaltochelatase subunit CobN [Trichodesmium sp. St16_bin2-tuft]|nr:cobaltochelatase subunit CobN [Trichodesmium sp. St16_bin2-tuft]
MHRIAAIPGGWNPQAEGVIFIKQTPAPIVFLTAADTDIQTLAAAVNKLPFDFPKLRVANLLHLQQQLTIDTYADDILSKAKVIILRLLGGRSYWSYGLEVLLEVIEKEGTKLIVIPGDDRPDPDLISYSNVSIYLVNQFWQYLIEGGVDNFVNGLKLVTNICLEKNYDFISPISVPRVGIYPRKKEEQNTKAKVGILFYRAHYLSGNIAPIDALCKALIEKNLEPVPVFVSSPRDIEVQREVLKYFQPENGEAIQLLLNTTSFAVSIVNNLDFSSEKYTNHHLLRQGKNLDVPVLQVIFSGGNFEQWESQLKGLSPRDVAMNIALPEVDGNIISRPVSFKAIQTLNSAIETDVISYFPVEDRIEFVSELAANWIKLRKTPASQRRIALILANYPNRDGRIANGVGLDTPASCVEILQALQQTGYYLENIPTTGDELIKRLTSGVTNDLESCELRPVFQSLSLAEFEIYFASFPKVIREKIIQRWANKNNIDFSTDVGINSTIIPLSFVKSVSSHFSEFQKDSDVKEVDNFPIPGLQLGNIFVGIQPSRGYDIDPSLNYHAPDLEPTPNYLAFYYWLRERFKIDAIIHVGKHGNLEWLPGKSVGLSQECFPEIALGALPHFYPFIVNDPGEGSQAKRRSQAVIIDHLTPPMTRAEIYGGLQHLENLIDEYYEAQNLDPSRLSVLRERIINLIEKEGINKDLSLEIESVVSDSEGSQKDPDFVSPSEINTEKLSIETTKIESVGSEYEGSQKYSNFLSSSEVNREKFSTYIESVVSEYEGSQKDSDFVSPSEVNREKFSTETDELNNDKNARFAKLINNIDGYLCELKEAQIRDGLHIFGQPPRGQQLRDLIIAIARHPSTTRLGLTRALAEDLNLDFDPLTDDFSTIINPSLVIDEKSCRTVGDAVELLEEKAASLVENLINQNLINSPFQQTNKELEWIRKKLLPSLQKTNQEIVNLLIGLDGKYIPSGSSGAPTRGRPDVLPTGRNFYSVDIRAIPTETAWRIGQLAAENLVERYTQENGEYPQTLGLSIWGTSTMRTGGDDIAEALALLGVKPVWDRPSRRVIDFEILPISILGRPRVDVTLRISGFFRDAFPNIIDLFDQAVIAVANLDEPETENPLATQVKKEVKYWQELGLTEVQAKARSQYRIFGSKPGAYGAGLQGLIESQNWQDDQDLARAYINWSSYAYTGINNSYNPEKRVINSPEAFSQRLQQMQIVLHNQDNREHDLLDSDDYYQFQGGMTVAVRASTGKNPHTYFGDNSLPENPKVRQLKEQIARVYRSRVVNPKWIAGVMRHGYKGAFEMAATIDYLFAYDATAKCVEDFMYQGVAEAYIFDENVQSFIQEKNPWALRDMAERLLEANQRGLWQSANHKTLDKLRAIALEAEGIIEANT